MAASGEKSDAGDEGGRGGRETGAKELARWGVVGMVAEEGARDAAPVADDCVREVADD